MADDRTFPWAAALDADQLSAFIDDLWGAASGDDDLVTLDAIEKTIAAHRPDPVHCPLTKRERAVLTELASGETHRTAARNLDLSPSVVHNITAELFTKLGVHNIAHAAAVAVHHGWLPELRVPEQVPPPPAFSTSGWIRVYREAADELRAAPGDTQDIGPYTSYSGASNAVWRIRKGLLKPFQPAGAFEALAARQERGHWFVTARYVGEPTPTTEAGTPS
ncbi:LuxR C-terminal-related transcriptional regulator [Streptomyces sp. NPDC002328]|uniref:helix-turn-helix transcriptional regulator n=1 Tax=Streptomyces sp. NPDC002328 TaxID=3364642 RepID=UPI0036B6F368